MSLLLVSLVAVAVAIAAAAYAWRVARGERLRSEARVAALAAAIEGTSEADVPAPMFERPGAGLQGRPLLKVGVGLAMTVFVVVLIAMSSDRREGVPAGTQAATREEPAEGLELLSMRHVRTGNSLTVTGLVRNRGEAAGTPITAVVLAFARDGEFVASGRAPLEFGEIARGDESPFQVTVPDVGDVGRYRVSFRTASGLVPHLDRRPALQVSAQ